MVVTAAIGPTVRSGPTEIAFALVVRCLTTISVDASLVARLRAVLLTVTVEAALALTTEAAVSIGAKRVGMTIMQAEIALVHIRTLRIRPAGLIGSETAVPVLIND